MPLYRLIRHVIFRPGSQETHEVWGIDRQPAALRTVGAPAFTDVDDPLNDSCSLLLVMRDGSYVTWNRFFEWLGEADDYRLVSGMKNLSPYSTFLLEGP
jgi:hypothetical protein